jgi:hypothetical protein
MVAKQCRIDGIPDKKSPKNQKINKPKAGAFQANPSSIPYQSSIFNAQTSKQETRGNQCVYELFEKRKDRFSCKNHDSQHDAHTHHT